MIFIEMYKAILILLSIAIYLNSLNCDFVFDDVSAIKFNNDLRSNQTSIFNLFYNDYWGTPIHFKSSHKSYRPLTVLTFRLNYSLHQLNPIGYHLVNVFIHTIVAILFYQFASSLFQQKYYGFISSLLFVLHPVHTEAVTSIVGRAELLAGLFYFLAFSSFINGNWVQPILYTAACLLSKEQAVTVLGVYCIYYLTIDRKWSSEKTYKPLLTRLLFIFLLALIALGFKIWIMNGHQTISIFNHFDNPASFAPTPIRQLTFFYLPLLNFKLLLFPFFLCCDWTMKSIPLVESFFDIRNFWSFLFYLMLSLVIYRSYQELILSFRHYAHKNLQNHSSILCTILAQIILPFLPASNLFIPVGFVIAERVLYLPSSGYCLLVVYGFKILETNWQITKPARWVLIVTCISFSLKTISRNFDWTNEYTLFTSGVKINPTNAKLYNNIGHYYEGKANWTLALDYFMKAQKLQPDDLGPEINIARVLIQMGQIDKAENMFWKIRSKAKKAVKFNQKMFTNYLSIWMNLANLISQNASRFKESEDIYNELISLKPDYVDAYINLGDILIKEGKVDEAISVYKKALEFGQNLNYLFYNLGVAYSLQLDDKNKTENPNFDLSTQLKKIASYFNQSLFFSPNNKDALINLAILVQKHSDLLKSFKNNLIKQMISYVGIDEERIWFNLALLYSDQSDNRKAEFYFRKALEKNPNFKNALFNLALLLIEEKRHFEAELYLTHLILYYPNHVKSWLLLGDIHFKFEEYEKAKKAYQTILEIDPNHYEANYNLCLIYSKMKKNNIPWKCSKNKFEKK